MRPLKVQQQKQDYFTNERNRNVYHWSFKVFCLKVGWMMNVAWCQNEQITQKQTRKGSFELKNSLDSFLCKNSQTETYTNSILESLLIIHT